jgi:hypothetical protein
MSQVCSYSSPPLCYYCFYHSSNLCYHLVRLSYDYKFRIHYGVALLHTVIAFVVQTITSLLKSIQWLTACWAKTKSYTLGFKAFWPTPPLSTYRLQKIIHNKYTFNDYRINKNPTLHNKITIFFFILLFHTHSYAFLCIAN